MVAPATMIWFPFTTTASAMSSPPKSVVTNPVPPPKERSGEPSLLYRATAKSSFAKSGDVKPATTILSPQYAREVAWSSSVMFVVTSPAAPKV